MLSDGSWVSGFNGKYIFGRVCGEILMDDPLRIRSAYVDVALERKGAEIGELMELFRGM